MFHPLSSPAPRAAAGLALTLCAVLSACTLPQQPAPPSPSVSPAAPPAAPEVRPEPVTAPVLRPVEAEPEAPATQLQPRAPGPLTSMLAHAERVRGLSGSALNAEINRLAEALSINGPDATLQMQQALALAQTRNSGDLGRALTLLQRVLADTGDDARSLHPLARLLAPRYQEQRRLEDERDRQAQQLKDAQRRIEQLNDRLEAVRAIERSFDRPASSGATPR